MKSINSILLIEDNAGDARLLREMLNEHGSHSNKLTHVFCMRDAEKHLLKQPADIILLDLGLPDADGLEAIRRIHVAAPRTPLVVLTGLDDETMSASALQEGAQDYLIKGQIEIRGLLRSMRYAHERKRLEWLKDEFVSSVSHELRTPLTSISAALGLLVAKTAGDLPAPAVHLISIAHLNSLRLVRLVNDILDIEKMDAGQVVFTLARVELRPLIEQVIEISLGLAEKFQVKIVFHPDQSDIDDVRADPDRLIQVVSNLLSNAIKFSQPDTDVEIAVVNGANVVRISVRDHGPGIPDVFKPRIFERFAQADGTDTKSRGGTGLGLSIVKQIVDRLGGKVSFADAPGGGTIFYVDLPRWKEEAGVAIDTPVQQPPRALLQNGRGAA